MQHLLYIQQYITIYFIMYYIIYINTIYFLPETFDYREAKSSR